MVTVTPTMLFILNILPLSLSLSQLFYFNMMVVLVDERSSEDQCASIIWRLCLTVLPSKPKIQRSPEGNIMIFKLLSNMYVVVLISQFDSLRKVEADRSKLWSWIRCQPCSPICSEENRTKVDYFCCCLSVWKTFQCRLTEWTTRCRLPVGMSLMMQVAMELKIIARDFNVAVLVSIELEKEFLPSVVCFKVNNEYVLWMSGDQSCNARREQSDEGGTGAVMESCSTHTNSPAETGAAQSFFQLTHSRSS